MRISMIASAFLASLFLQSCTSVSLPDIDFMGESDFAEDVENLDGTYQSAGDIPTRPTDVRSAAEWDESVREMQALQEGADFPDLEPGLSDEAFDREFEAGQAAAKAYQEDDPS